MRSNVIKSKAGNVNDLRLSEGEKIMMNVNWRLSRKTKSNMLKSLDEKSPQGKNIYNDTHKNVEYEDDI